MIFCKQNVLAIMCAHRHTTTRKSFKSINVLKRATTTRNLWVAVCVWVPQTQSSILSIMSTCCCFHDPKGFSPSSSKIWQKHKKDNSETSRSPQTKLNQAWNNRICICMTLSNLMGTQGTFSLSASQSGLQHWPKLRHDWLFLWNLRKYIIRLAWQTPESWP